MAVSTSEDLADMGRRWPAWRIWRAGGSWMATRRRPLSMDEIAAGMAATLMEDSRRDLGERLAEQHRIEWGA